jgi:IS30 family transposase
MKKLNWTQRNLIAEGLREGKSNAQIAREIGVHRSTIGREIERNAKSREEYCPREADDLSWKRQQEAMPKRNLLFGGIRFGTKLKSRNQIYTYHSHTHLNKISRYLISIFSWDTAYIRPHAKKQFVPDNFYKRYRTAEKSHSHQMNNKNQLPENSFNSEAKAKRNNYFIKKKNSRQQKAKNNLHTIQNLSSLRVCLSNDCKQIFFKPFNEVILNKNTERPLAKRAS